jgi:hypothetical protein
MNGFGRQQERCGGSDPYNDVWLRILAVLEPSSNLVRSAWNQTT